MPTPCPFFSKYDMTRKKLMRRDENIMTGHRQFDINETICTVLVRNLSSVNELRGMDPEERPTPKKRTLTDSRNSQETMLCTVR